MSLESGNRWAELISFINSVSQNTRQCVLVFPIQAASIADKISCAMSEHKLPPNISMMSEWEAAVHAYGFHNEQQRILMLDMHERQLRPVLFVVDQQAVDILATQRVLTQKDWNRNRCNLTGAEANETSRAIIQTIERFLLDNNVPISSITAMIICTTQLRLLVNHYFSTNRSGEMFALSADKCNLGATSNSLKRIKLSFTIGC